MIGPNAAQAASLSDEARWPEAAADVRMNLWVLTDVHEEPGVSDAMMEAWGKVVSMWQRQPQDWDGEQPSEPEELLESLKDKYLTRPAGYVRQDEIYWYETGIVYVNVYQVNRRFGGPEEGGWYYDAAEIHASFPTTQDRVAAVTAMAKDVYGYLDDPDHALSSVLSKGKIFVKIEDAPGADSPRPRYE